MTKQQKIIFTFPYHDPTGKYNEIFQNKLPELFKIFSDICISVTPPTAKQNKQFVNFLKKESCIIFENKINTNVGDHMRNALKAATKKAGSRDKIFFSFIDRVLFQLDSKYHNKFLTDLKKDFNADYLVFERSRKIWAGYPQAYREMENHISEIGALIFGQKIEYNTCAFLMNKQTANKILSHSKTTGINTLGEWVLLYKKLSGNLPQTKKVDWLAWEDPYWEKLPTTELKKQKELDQNETLNRIKSNTEFVSLFLKKYGYRFQKPVDQSKN